MSKIASCNDMLDQIFLALTDQERTVIEKRFSINGSSRMTLEEIGSEYSITRERVRQIERNALNKLIRISPQTDISHILTATINIIQEHGGVMSEDKLKKELSRKMHMDFLTLYCEVNPELSKIKKSLKFTKAWFIPKQISRDKVIAINTIAQELLSEAKAIVSENNFLRRITTNFPFHCSQTKVKAALSINKQIKRIDEGYGLTKWRSVQPKSIRDKALIILNRQGQPMHFRSIAEAILLHNFDSKNVTVQAVHNELIRYPDFVLVGRGIYALRKWGFEDGTVKDVILDILKDGKPKSKSEIVNEVLKRRKVKIGTISLNLQKHPEFKRVGRAVYTLA